MICHVLIRTFSDKFLFSIIEDICLLRSGLGIGDGGGGKLLAWPYLRPTGQDIQALSKLDKATLEMSLRGKRGLKRKYIG